MFQVIPAVDIARGDVVRLREGDPGERRVYGDDPVAWASRWLAAGAERLHVVDLDAAFDLAAANRAVIAEICGLGMPVQLGGGVRDRGRAEDLLACGVRWLITGTLLRDQEAFERFVASIGPDRLMVALDIRHDRLQASGWRESLRLLPEDAFTLALRLGVRRFLVTAVERDGTELGPNFGLLSRFSGRGAEVLAAGGVGALDDLQRLRDLGVDGAVVGRALYEGRFTLEDALGAAAC